MNTVRCAAPIGTHHIWREIWLDRLRISRGWWVGSTPLRAAVLAQPVRSKTCSTPRDLRYALAEADASFKSTTQARGTDWVARSNGRGQIARSLTVKEVKPLELSYLSVWRRRIQHSYHLVVAPWACHRHAIADRPEPQKARRNSNCANPGPIHRRRRATAGRPAISGAERGFATTTHRRPTPTRQLQRC